MAKLTADFVKFQYQPAVEGIKALADKFEENLKNDFLHKNHKLFKQADKEAGLLFSYSDNGTGTLHIVSSVAAGLQKCTWDSANWAYIDATAEQQALWTELNLTNKVKEFKQDLTAKNEVIQTAIALEAKILPRIDKLFDKVCNAAEKAGYPHNQDWFYEACSYEEGDNNDWFELNQETGMWFVELFEVLKYEAQVMVDGYKDM